MLNKLIITVSIVALTAIIFLILRISYSRNYNEKIKILFSNARYINKKIPVTQIHNLPTPVKNYLKYALQDNQDMITCVRLKHEGQFKMAPEKPWKNITGEQYFITENPGFLWKGKIGLISAQDQYINNKGKLIVTLFDAFAIMNKEGHEVDQGELLRWLGESVWFPTNLIPGEHLKWEPIDDISAKLIYAHSKQSVSYKVTFNKIGQIVQLETKRYYNGKNLEKWIGNCSEYKEINGFMIPTVIRGTWELASGEFTYANFKLTEIEYDIPERYR